MQINQNTDLLKGNAVAPGTNNYSPIIDEKVRKAENFKNEGNWSHHCRRSIEYQIYLKSQIWT